VLICWFFYLNGKKIRNKRILEEENIHSFAYQFMIELKKKVMNTHWTFDGISERIKIIDRLISID